MPLDPRLAHVLTLINAEPPLTGTAAERRSELARRQAERGPLLAPTGAPELHSVTDHHVGDVLVRVYRPSAGVLLGLVHIHGGAWWLGSVDEDDLGCRRRAARMNAVVLSVDYRLAPENPYPAGLDDCWAATRWAFDNADELELSRIVVGGGSAGGNLAAAVGLRARDAGGPDLAGLLLEFPGMDLSWSSESFELYGEGYGFTKEGLRECAAWYAHDLTDPFVSPVLADLRGLPATLVTTAEYDPVRDGGEQFAQLLADAGGDVVLERFDGIAHGCGEVDLLPDVTERYRQVVAAFLERVVGGVRTS